MFLAKYDAAGNGLWAVGVGGPQVETASVVRSDASGSAFLGGTFSSDVLQVGGFAVTNHGNADSLVAKLNLDLPQLTILSSGPSIAVSWPQYQAGYLLEKSGALGSASVWSLVTNSPPATVGSQLVVSIPVGTSNIFFRLRKP